ncbi:hypothetical protein AC1031_001075 [Aphanomyces cochlioides]|nr:hypothetical protein AC1031_001075 [Aphanomyces cochlioides]
MQAATEAVRRRWPLAAGVTATATALVYAGLQAYTSPPPTEKDRQTDGSPSTAGPSPTREDGSPTSSPNRRSPSPKKRMYTSVLHAPYFHYFLGPALLGLAAGAYVVLLHFDVIDISAYPSIWDICARCLLILFGALHGLLLGPFLTETHRLRPLRVHIIDWLATSRFMDAYVSQHMYMMLLLVGIPVAFLSAEVYWHIIPWTDGQFYIVVALLDALMANFLWHYYTLVHLNPNLRHL